jgi:hypothetical protein
LHNEEIAGFGKPIEGRNSCRAPLKYFGCSNVLTQVLLQTQTTSHGVREFMHVYFEVIGKCGRHKCTKASSIAGIDVGGENPINSCEQ